MRTYFIRFAITVAAVFVALFLYDVLSPRGSRSAKKAYVLVQGVQQAQYLKVQMMEYVMMEGKFPESNMDLNMPESGYGDDVKSIQVVEDGEIVITFDRSSGINNGQVVLRLEEDESGLNWTCYTHDYISIDRWLPQCEYLVP